MADPESKGGDKQAPKAGVSWWRLKIDEFKEQVSTLKGAPRELWLTYFLKFLESYAYFAVSYIFVIFLSDEFGFSDAEAGWIYGLFGTIYAVTSMFMGAVVDNIGVRRSLLLGGVVLTLSRFALAITASRAVIYIVVFGTLPFGSSLGIPVMATGIRRYTNDANRAFGYSLFYIAMNISAFVAGLLVDAFRYAFGVPDPHARLAQLAAAANSTAAAAPKRHASQLVVSLTAGADGTGGMTGYRWLVLSAAAATALFLLLAALFVREIEVNESGGTSTFVPRRSNPVRLAREIFFTKRFWRFILLILLLTGVRSVLRHLDTTFPKYATREIGPQFPYGTIISINPLLIIVLVPLVTAFYYSRTSPFECITTGVFVTGASPFFLVVGPYYYTAIAFILMLSVGEAIWSPRLYEYTCTIAPVGREGTYQSLAVIPLFAAKLLVGGVSGMLLDTFCPLDGPRNSRVMWLIIGAFSISSPMLMLLLRGVIEKKDPEEQLGDEGAKAAAAAAVVAEPPPAEPPGGGGLRPAGEPSPRSAGAVPAPGGAGRTPALAQPLGAAVELRAPGKKGSALAGAEEEDAEGR